MKFDKFMEVCFRVLAIISACVVFLGALVSCFLSDSDIDIKVCADTVVPDWVFPFEEYTSTYEEKINTIQSQDGYLSSVINDSNLSWENKRDILYGNALQTYDYAFCLQLLAHWNDGEFPDTAPEVPVSMSGYSGVFYYTTDNKYHFVTGFRNSSIIATSDLFNIVIDSNSDYTFTNYQYNNNSGFCGCTVLHGQSSGMRAFDSSNFFSGSVSASWAASDSTFSVFISTSGIPNISDNMSLDSFTSLTNAIYRAIGGYGTLAELPQGDIDCNNPWEYYNETLLPYLKNNIYADLPDSIDISQLLVFPNGYYPSIEPDPTEPATFPNGGIYIDKQFNVGINIITPTDGNGQPVTDTNGETVTETVYATETYPPDGDYRFRLPTLDTLTMHQATAPNPDLSPFTDGFAFIWNCVDHFFNDTGFMPVVVACLSLSVLAFVLWKVGG